MEGMLDHLHEEGFTVKNIDPVEYWKARAERAEKKLEGLELVASYAKDVIDFWPNMTFRTIRVMIPKMAALKEALELFK